MLTVEKEKIEKLPKWAQDHFRVLSRRCAEKDAAIALLHGDVASKVFVRGYGEKDRPLGDNATVVFDVGDREYIEIVISRDIKGEIEVRGSCFGKPHLRIRPCVSNVVTIALSE